MGFGSSNVAMVSMAAAIIPIANVASPALRPAWPRAARRADASVRGLRAYRRADGRVALGGSSPAGAAVEDGRDGSRRAAFV